MRNVERKAEIHSTFYAKALMKILDRSRRSGADNTGTGLTAIGYGGAYRGSGCKWDMEMLRWRGGEEKV